MINARATHGLLMPAGRSQSNDQTYVRADDGGILLTDSLQRVTALNGLSHVDYAVS